MAHPKCLQMRIIQLFRPSAPRLSISRSLFASRAFPTQPENCALPTIPISKSVFSREHKRWNNNFSYYFNITSVMSWDRLNENRSEPLLPIRLSLFSRAKGRKYARRSNFSLFFYPFLFLFPTSRTVKNGSGCKDCAGIFKGICLEKARKMEEQLLPEILQEHSFKNQGKAK